MKQYTDTLMMIRPVNFTFNAETAVNNYYQDGSQAGDDSQEKALAEFDGFVEKLRSKGVNVVVVEDTPEPFTPDSIFPNNWVSFHSNGNVGLYPMYAENRRKERRADIFDLLKEQGYAVNDTIDYTGAEADNVFLEGTGSMILDRENRKVYAAISDRTDENLLLKFTKDFDFYPVVFDAYQSVGDERKPIYHTNVMMCVADQFAIICLDSIDDVEQRMDVISALEEDDKEVIEISEDQVENFAGNMLQVEGNGQKYLVMSQAAKDSLTEEQVEAIEKYCPIISSSLTTIETLGGGSARCMMAEVFLPKQS